VQRTNNGGNIVAISNTTGTVESVKTVALEVAGLSSRLDISYVGRRIAHMVEISSGDV